MTVLSTERLVLRPFEIRDFDDFAVICADPEVMRYLGAGRPMARDDAWRHMALLRGHQELRGYGLSAVIERATGRLVGRGGLWYPDGWPGLEVGWALARPFWGAGYATELGRACVAYAFDELGADEVISLIDPDNARSIAVAERIGHAHLYDTDVRGSRCHVYGRSRR